MPSLSRLRLILVVTVTALGLVLLATDTLTDSLPGSLASRMLDDRDAPDESVLLTRTEAHGGEVAGRLGKRQRKRAVREVAAVVDAWIDAAYVDVAYPTRSFAGAYDGFSDRAERLARRDRLLLTNARLGRRIDAVTVHRRSVRVDLLASGGRAQAATARVRLVLKTDQPRKRVTVSGRLFLTPKRDRWRIFGYDLAKGKR